MEDMFEHGVIDVAERLMADRTGTGDPMNEGDRAYLRDWLSQRISDGVWIKSDVPRLSGYDDAVRALARAALESSR